MNSSCYHLIVVESVYSKNDTLYLVDCGEVMQCECL